MTITVSSLFLYPIKACRPLSLRSAFLGPRGLEYGGIGDRRLMLVDAEGSYVSQRQRPELAVVTVAPEDGRLLVSAPGAGVTKVDLADIGSPRSVLLFGKEVIARPCAREAARWFSNFLGQKVELVYQTDEDLRLAKPEYAVNPGADHVGYADAFPFLIVNDASLRTLNEVLPVPVPMNRFRPNIVVSGAPSDAEYGWTRIAVGCGELAVVKPCDRCVVTTIDQEKGQRTGADPLATLARIRLMDQDWRGGHIRGAIFGQNAIATIQGTIAVGDMVTLLESGSPPAWK